MNHCKLNEHWCQFHHSLLFYLAKDIYCFCNHIHTDKDKKKKSLPLGNSENFFPDLEEHLSQVEGVVAVWIGHVTIDGTSNR